MRHITELTFKTRIEAAETLNNIANLIDSYGYMPISDLGIVSNFGDATSEHLSQEDTLYGWTNINDFRIGRCSKGYSLSIPEAILLEAYQVEKVEKKDNTQKEGSYPKTPETMAAFIAERLRTFREEASMSVSEVSHKSGVAIYLIVFMENEMIPITDISLDIMLKLANVFHCPVASFIFDFMPSLERKGSYE